MDGLPPADTHQALLRRAELLYQDVQDDPTSSAHAGPTAELAEVARRGGAIEALVVVLRAQAYAQRTGFANDAAKTLLDAAARLARRHGLDRQLVQILLTRSGISQELGRVGAAQRDLDQVRTLMVGGESSDYQLQQAVLFHNAGRLANAAQMYRQVLADPAASVTVRAKTANNLGEIEVMLGDVDDAVAHLELATVLAGQCSPPIQAGVATTRSWVAMQAGRLTDSLRQFDEAGRVYVAAGLPLGSHYLQYADALIELRLLPEAKAVADRAVQELERTGVALMAAEGQVRRARLALLLGDARGAIDAATAAAGQFGRQRRFEWAAQTTTIVVDAQVQLGQVSAESFGRIRRAAATFERLQLPARAVEAHLTAGRAAVNLAREQLARQHFRRAQRLAGDSAPVLVRLKSDLAGALEHRMSGDDAAVLRHCRAGLTDLARHRDAFASLELRVLASGHGAELGRLGLSVLLRAGTPAQVFAWLERTRAAALVAVQPVSTVGIDDDLAELRTVQLELAALDGGADQPGADGTEAESLTTASEVAALSTRQAAIEDRIRHATWTGAAAARTVTTDPTSPAALRRLLGGRTLVEYGVLDGQLIAAVLDARRTRVFPLGPLSALQHHVDLLLFALRRLSRPERSAAATTAARSAADAALAGLQQQLFDNLGLPPDAPVVVVPTGALQRIPWSALRGAPVAVAPSAAFWAATAERRTLTRPTDSVVLVAGPALTGATAEVEALRRLHPAPTVLLPPDSTVGAVTAALAGAGLAHLACHGRLRSDNPSFSALQLSDGFLTVHELDVRGIAPHRIVLASCDSAADASYEGNEVLGFVSALMARGTGGLVASIVVVPDATAVTLMQALHRRILAGETLDQSLFAARDSVDPGDPADFVAWCAFNAYGAA